MADNIPLKYSNVGPLGKLASGASWLASKGIQGLAAGMKDIYTGIGQGLISSVPQQQSTPIQGTNQFKYGQSYPVYGQGAPTSYVPDANATAVRPGLINSQAGKEAQKATEQYNIPQETPKTTTETPQTTTVTPQTTTQPTPFNQNVQTLTQFGMQNDPDVKAQYEKINQLQKEYAANQASMTGGGGQLAPMQGERSKYQQLYTERLSAEQNTLASILQQKGLSLQAAQAAAGLTAPQAYGPTNVPYYPGQGYGQTAIGQFGQNGAFSVGQLEGNIGLGQQYQQVYLPAFNQGNAVANELMTFLDQNPDINPTNLNKVNFWNAWLKGQQLSDPRYQQLSAYLNDMLGNYGRVLGTQGTTDYKQSLVQSMLDSSASTQSLKQQITNLTKLASTNLQAIQSTGTGGNMFGSFFQK